MKTTYIWFSRHAITAQQAREMINLGADENITIANHFITIACHLAAVQLTSEQDVIDLWSQLMTLAKAEGDVVIFGVIPPALREFLLGKVNEANNYACKDDIMRQVDLYESWNTMRSEEGGKPTFQHKRFCMTGKYLILLKRGHKPMSQ